VKVSLKTEYAMKAVMDLSLAYREGTELRKIKEIAKSQNIPEKYLVQILLELNRGGLLTSIRGVNGGYRLSKAPSAITLYDVISTVEGRDPIIECLLPQGTKKKCATGLVCPFRDAWQKVNEAMSEILSATTFDDICRNVESSMSMYFI